MPASPLATFCRSRSSLIASCLVIGAAATVFIAAVKRPIKNPTYDPSLPAVDLFDGVEQGLFEVTLIPKNSFGGNVFIENKTKKPLSVKIPQAAAAVQVLKQAGFGAGGMGMGGGGGARGQGGAAGGGQSMGGMMGGGMGMMGGGMGMMGGGMGMMSIPPEKVVQVPMKSVCLNHGKAEPRPKMIYQLVKLETYTQDPVLQEFLKGYVAGEVDPQAAQAAAWHITDKMSWQQLADKNIEQIGSLPEPYFTPDQLIAAQQLVSRAQARARDRKPEAETPATTPAKESPGAGSRPEPQRPEAKSSRRSKRAAPPVQTD